MASTEAGFRWPPFQRVSPPVGVIAISWPSAASSGTALGLAEHTRANCAGEPHVMGQEQGEAGWLRETPETKSPESPEAPGDPTGGDSRVGLGQDEDGIDVYGVEIDAPKSAKGGSTGRRPCPTEARFCQQSRRRGGGHRG
jgi:hypothetical protein